VFGLSQLVAIPGRRITITEVLITGFMALVN
jgi:hypothetical protein